MNKASSVLIKQDKRLNFDRVLVMSFGFFLLMNATNII